MYEAELFQKQKWSPGTVTIRLAALRFFYIKTLKKVWSIAETPDAKRPLNFPSILSQEEVTRLIDSALTPYHRILLMTLYAMDRVIALLREMKKLPLAGKDSVQCAIVEIEQVRCDMNAGFTEKLAERERFDEGSLFPARPYFSGGRRSVPAVRRRKGHATASNGRSTQSIGASPGHSFENRETCFLTVYHLPNPARL